MIEQPSAPSALRNAEPILAVLRQNLPEHARVLEIGSGTGQHALHFANAMPHVYWQTSDRLSNLNGIRSWIAEARHQNIGEPIELDVASFHDSLGSSALSASFDAVFSANTAHIMNVNEVRSMLFLVANFLSSGGRFLLYGPFRIDGKFTSASNEGFDRTLKSQNAAMGIRDLEWIGGVAEANGLHMKRRYAMPSNNLLLVWQKEGDARVHE